MTTLIGLTTAPVSSFADYLQADFSQVTRGGITYNKLFAFAEHIDERFERAFASEEELQEWLTDFVYFIVPTDYVPFIKHYRSVVQEAYPHLAFNIVCRTETINIAGADTVVPASVVNVLPGSAAYFDEAGIAIIDSIISSWNAKNPAKMIPQPYRFDTYRELIAYRDTCTAP